MKFLISLVLFYAHIDTKKYQEYKGFYECSLKNAAREKERGGETPNYELLERGGWECKCGRVHPSYVGTCACGTTRDEMQEFCP